MTLTPRDLPHFIAHHCTGRQYDSCVSSPCQHASAYGCRHPLHPRNAGPHVATLNAPSWDGALVRRQAA